MTFLSAARIEGREDKLMVSSNFLRVPKSIGSITEKTRGKHVYLLKFAQEGERPAKNLQFEASEAFPALMAAHREGRRHAAELWRDGRNLCTVKSHPETYWKISWSKDRLQ